MSKLFAKNLKMLLEKFGMTPNDLAIRINSNESTVYRWLNPSLSYLPRSRTRLAICTVFNVDPFKLVHEDLTKADLSSDFTSSEAYTRMAVALDNPIPMVTASANLVLASVCDDDVELRRDQFTPAAEKWLPAAPDNSLKQNQLVAIVASGNAMAPEIRAGDIVYVEFEFGGLDPVEYKDGDTVLAFSDKKYLNYNEAEPPIIRKIVFGDNKKEFWLKATNPDWPGEQTVKGLSTLGKVVAIFRKLSA